MALRDAFTDDEWREVCLAPMLAGFAVTAADPSGLIGTVRESSAAAWSIRAAKEQPGTLANEVALTYEAPDSRSAAQAALHDLVRGRRPEEATEAAVARLAGIARLVEAKAPDEAEAFAAWLSVTAQTVAEAGREGGFLGFGGEMVSEAERRTLAEIDAALGLPAG